MPFAMCVVAALSFGLAYATRDGNQVTYLLDGLRRVDPDFLRSDWLAAETFAYHPSFAWVVVAAAALGSVPWVLAVLNVAIITASLWLLHRLFRDLVPDIALPATAALVALVVIGGTLSVGMSYIFSRELQPSGLASLALVGAITAFVRGRWTISGIALAISGVLHSNFLLVGIAAFGLAHAILTLITLHVDGRDAWPERIRAAGFQLGPTLLVLGLQLPMLVSMAGDPAGEAARRIFLEVRSPHHYLPRTYLITFLPFIAWHLLAWAVPFPFGEAVRRRWMALHASMVALVLVATLLTTVIFVPVVSQLFFWRLAPFAVLLAQMVAVAGAAVWLVAQRGAVAQPNARHRLLRLCAAATAALLLLRHAAWSEGQVSPLAIGIAAVAGAITLILWRAARPAGTQFVPSPHALAFTVFLFAAVLGIRSGLGRSNLLTPDVTPTELALYDWASRTPLETRFLVPPEMSSFRLRAARSIVVDWKSTPILPAQLLEWYRRIDAVAGGTAPGTIDEAAAGYRALDMAHLARLAAEFDVDYAVMPRAAALAHMAMAARRSVVWQGEDHFVIDVRGLRRTKDATHSSLPPARNR